MSDTVRWSGHGRAEARAADAITRLNPPRKPPQCNCKAPVRWNSVSEWRAFEQSRPVKWQSLHDYSSTNVAAVYRFATYAPPRHNTSEPERGWSISCRSIYICRYITAPNTTTTTLCISIVTFSLIRPTDRKVDATLESGRLRPKILLLSTLAIRIANKHGTRRLLFDIES